MSNESNFFPSVSNIQELKAAAAQRPALEFYLPAIEFLLQNLPQDIATAQLIPLSSLINYISQQEEAMYRRDEPGYNYYQQKIQQILPEIEQKIEGSQQIAAAKIEALTTLVFFQDYHSIDVLRHWPMNSTEVINTTFDDAVEHFDTRFNDNAPDNEPPTFRSS